jgi:putative redox protein
VVRERNRYVPRAEMGESMAQVLLRSVANAFTTQITTERHVLIADEPRPAGEDLGPTPYELLLSALGACTSMTLIGYARRQDWPLTEVQIELTHDRNYREDCDDCERPEARMEAVQRRIHLEGPLTDDQQQRDRRLVRLAERDVIYE